MKAGFCRPFSGLFGFRIFGLGEQLLPMLRAEQAVLTALSFCSGLQWQCCSSCMVSSLVIDSNTLAHARRLEAAHLTRPVPKLPTPMMNHLGC